MSEQTQWLLLLGYAAVAAAVLLRLWFQALHMRAENNARFTRMTLCVAEDMVGGDRAGEDDVVGV